MIICRFAEPTFHLLDEVDHGRADDCIVGVVDGTERKIWLVGKGIAAAFLRSGVEKGATIVVTQKWAGHGSGEVFFLSRPNPYIVSYLDCKQHVSIVG